MSAEKKATRCPVPVPTVMLWGLIRMCVFFFLFSFGEKLVILFLFDVAARNGRGEAVICETLIFLHSPSWIPFHQDRVKKNKQKPPFLLSGESKLHRCCCVPNPHAPWVASALAHFFFRHQRGKLLVVLLPKVEILKV